MDGDSIPSIIAIVILIALSAYFSATETAFSTMNRVRLKSLIKSGNKKAGLALRLADNYDKLLSTILVGNNIVNIATASISTLLFVNLYGPYGATISTIVITVVVLIFGEITPKGLAKESPEKFAMFASPFINALVVILTPINFIFTQWKKLLNKLFRSPGGKGMTEEELLTIVEEAEQDGAINEDESELIHSVIDFTDLKVRDIITPRVDIVGVDKNAGRDEIIRAFSSTGFSRLPVYDEDCDHIIGILNQKDFFNLVMAGDYAGAAAAMKPPLFIPPAAKISGLLKDLQKAKVHMAVVLDEYGGTLGIVTMEDILEELVGEIWDEHDEVVEDFMEVEDNTYRINCGAELDKLFDYLSITGDTGATTVSGWIMERLEKIPEPGDSFRYGSVTVIVEKVEDNRVMEAVINVEPDGEGSLSLSA